MSEKQSKQNLADLMASTPEGGSVSQSTDKLFLNGHIITMDEENPVVEAMAVKGEKIRSVGGTSALKEAYPYADVVDLEGKTVMLGMLADFIVISHDVRTVDPKQLLSIEVLQTYVGGRLVYDSESDIDLRTAGQASL